MALLNLNSKFDTKALLDVPYTIVSHEKKVFSGETEDYDIAIATTKTGQRVGFSGKAVISAFDELDKQLGNPYRYPVRITLGEEKTRSNPPVNYRVVKSAETLDKN